MALGQGSGGGRKDVGIEEDRNGGWGGELQEGEERRVSSGLVRSLKGTEAWARSSLCGTSQCPGSWLRPSDEPICWRGCPPRPNSAAGEGGVSCGPVPSSSLPS